MSKTPSPPRGEAGPSSAGGSRQGHDERKILKQLMGKGRVEARSGPFGGEASLPQRSGYLPIPLWQRPILPDISKLSIGLPDPPPESNEELIQLWSKKFPLLQDMPAHVPRVQYEHVRSKVAVLAKRGGPESAFESRTGRAVMDGFRLAVAIFGAVQAGRRAAAGTPAKAAPVRYVETSSERVWSQDDVLKVVGTPLGFLKRDYAHVRTLVELRFRTEVGHQLTFEGITSEGLFLVGLKFPLSPGPALHAWTLSGTMVKIDVPVNDQLLAWFCKKRRVTTQELQEMQRESEEALKRSAAHGGFFYAPVSYYLGAARATRTEVQRLLLLEHGWRFLSWRGHVRTFWRRPELPGEPEIMRAHVAVRGADPDLVAALVWHLPSRLSWDRMLLAGTVIDDGISGDVKVEHVQLVSPELDPAPRDLCLLWSRLRTRAGWIVACQSVQHERCPRLGEGCVRSEVVRMGYGIAARAKTVDVFLVYQFDPKGDPTVEARSIEFFNSNQPRCLETLRQAIRARMGGEPIVVPRPSSASTGPSRPTSASPVRPGSAAAAARPGSGSAARPRSGSAGRPGSSPGRRPNSALAEAFRPISPEKRHLDSNDSDSGSSDGGIDSAGELPPAPDVPPPPLRVAKLPLARPSAWQPAANAGPRAGSPPRRASGLLPASPLNGAQGRGRPNSKRAGPAAEEGDLFTRTRKADGEWRFELREGRPLARSWSDIFI